MPQYMNYYFLINIVIIFVLFTFPVELRGFCDCVGLQGYKGRRVAGVC
jgi:hypothetical protein